MTSRENVCVCLSSFLCALLSIVAFYKECRNYMIWLDFYIISTNKLLFKRMMMKSYLFWYISKHLENFKFILRFGIYFVTVSDLLYLIIYVCLDLLVSACVFCGNKSENNFVFCFGYFHYKFLCLSYNSLFSILGRAKSKRTTLYSFTVISHYTVIILCTG